MKRSFLAALATIALAACSSSSSPSTQPTTTPPVDTGTKPVDDAVVDETPLTPAAYPDGPYGIVKGNVIENHTWKGYRDASGDWTDVSMADYFDPDGSKGIYAIYVVVSAQWCVPCQQEAKLLPRMYDAYKARGARFLSAMLQKSNGDPAEQLTVDAWIKAFKINFDIVAAPTPVSGSPGMSQSELVPKSWAIPRNYVINPRDMKIVYVITAALDPAATDIKALDNVLDALGAPGTSPAPGDAGGD